MPTGFGAGFGAGLAGNTGQTGMIGQVGNLMNAQASQMKVSIEMKKLARTIDQEDEAGKFASRVLDRLENIDDYTNPDGGLNLKAVTRTVFEEAREVPPSAFAKGFEALGSAFNAHSDYIDAVIKAQEANYKQGLRKIVTESAKASAASGEGGMIDTGTQTALQGLAGQGAIGQEKTPTGFQMEQEAAAARTAATSARAEEGLELRKQDFVRGVRKDMEALPDVKKAIDRKEKYMSIKAAYEESIGSEDNVAIDQALINLYNKVTDPESVVRESEYKRTGENLPLINKFLGAFEKVKRGGAGLTDEDRKALVDMTKRLYEVSEKRYNARLDEYRGYIEEALPGYGKYLKPFNEVQFLTESGEFNDEVFGGGGAAPQPATPAKPAGGTPPPEGKSLTDILNMGNK